MTLVMNGISLMIVWFGGKQIEQSNLQVGDMMAFIQYAMHVIMSFLFISMMFIMVPRAPRSPPTASTRFWKPRAALRTSRTPDI